MGDGLYVNAGVSPTSLALSPLDPDWWVLFGDSCEPHAFHSTQRTWGRHQRRDGVGERRGD